MSPRSFGNVMADGPVRSAGAEDMVRACLAPASVAEQRRPSTLEFHSFQRRADTALWPEAGGIPASRKPCPEAEPTHEPGARATNVCAAALAADPHVAVEPDLRWPGTLACRLRLP